MSIGRTQAQAWMGPDGLIEIHFHTGCIENVCRTNHALAHIAAHEISHVLLRHGPARAHLPSACQEAEHMRIEQEFEADYLGLMLMARAGFDPEGALEWLTVDKKAWDKHKRVYKKPILPGERTHPSVSLSPLFHARAFS